MILRVTSMASGLPMTMRSLVPEWYLKFGAVRGRFVVSQILQSGHLSFPEFIKFFLDDFIVHFAETLDIATQVEHFDGRMTFAMSRLVKVMLVSPHLPSVWAEKSIFRAPPFPLNGVAGCDCDGVWNLRSISWCLISDWEL